MKGEHTVAMLCDLLNVSRSGYYCWEESPPTARQRKDDEQFLDYALLRLEGYPGAEPVGGRHSASSAPMRGWVDLLASVADPTPQMPVLILQHPRGGPLQLSMGHVLETSPTRIWHAANTEPGSAGAPCFGPEWKLMGLQSAGGPKWNEAIRISAIVRSLERQGLLGMLGGRDLA